MNNKTFLLVQVQGTKATVIKEGLIQIIQAEKSKLKKQPQFKDILLQVRTPEGFKAVPILPNKKKK